MANKKNDSMIKRALKLWLNLKVAKGATRMVAPVAMAGAGYLLYKKFRGGSSVITSS